jgi:prephenate dehydrogenase
MKTVGLIGFGQFGQLIAKHVGPRADMTVFDLSDRSREANELGVKLGDIKEAAASDVVIVAVPVQSMLQTFVEIAPLLTKKCLVIDVASVKVLPIRWMLQTLPPYVDIIGTHPLFGPQSARDGLDDLPLVVCPVRGNREKWLINFAQDLKLKVSIATPEEHDEEMAYVQALTHLIGRTLLEIKIPDENFKTRSYQHLLELCSLIGNDSFELFAAIQSLNPYAPKIASSFIRQARSLLQSAVPDNEGS